MDESAVRIEELTKRYKIGTGAYTRVQSIWQRRRAGQMQQRDGRDDVDDDELLEEDEPVEEPPETGAREVLALDGVSLEIAQGSRVAILGQAASGKTTLLKVLGRISPPTSGRAYVRGRVAPLLETASAFMNPYATGRANALLLAHLFGVPREVVERHLGEIAELADLGARIDHPAGTYSTRVYRRLGLATVLHMEPDVLLVDEQLVGNDPDFGERCAARLHEIADQGATLLFAARDPAPVAQYCDEAVWLASGRVISTGPLPGARAPRRVAWGARAEPPPGIAALGREQRTLVEALVTAGRDYGDLARELGTTPDEVRERARAACEDLAPDGGRLDATTRAAIVDHLLGQPQPDADPARIFATPPARVWARMLTILLEPFGAGALVEFPRQAPDPALATASGGLAPPLEPSAAALADFLEVSLGRRRAREAVTMATDKAVWKELQQVKWADVAEAAGVPHEEGQAVLERLLRLRALARMHAPAAHAFDGRVSLIEATLTDADGEPVEALPLRVDAVVEVTIETAAPGVELRLQLLLEAAGASPLRVSQPDPFRAEVAGRYRVRARLPAGLLHDAHYTGRVVLRAQLDGQEDRLELPEAFAFEAFDPADEQAAELVEPVGPVAWEVTA
jgi:ABC-type polysaccharide/polyol phosphate transport system ATPase subunit